MPMIALGHTAPELFSFGLAPDREVTIEVVSGDPIEFCYAINGPFPETPDGTIGVGETHTFTQPALLHTTGGTEIETTTPPLEDVVPEDNRPPGPP